MSDTLKFELLENGFSLKYWNKCTEFSKGILLYMM